MISAWLTHFDIPMHDAVVVEVDHDACAHGADLALLSE
jgi:hypothetical protein